MLELEPSQAVPLILGPGGTIRFSGSRVTLDSIVRGFQRGATAEQIQEDFPSVALGDIYSAIAYYLGHKPSVDRYLRAQQKAAAQVRREIERRQNSPGIRRRLLARRRHAVT